jgi:uncharacterized protein YbjQ (UPF0145 family)
MHKNVFKVAVASSALALAATASAVVEKAETGNVLLFPYYTTENTNSTLINVINTTDQTKALKVRFREAKGSEDSLDFHVYMSPKDRWTAAMTQDSDGVPTLVTQDNTCTFGRVRGNPIRARHQGRDVMAVFRNVAGGEVTEYTKMLAEAREQAIDRMTAEAETLGADAVVGVRFQTSMVMKGAAEMLCYGTAVELERV